MLPILATAYVQPAFFPAYAATTPSVRDVINVERGPALSSSGVELEDVSWFYSPRWQEGEARVDEHIRAGSVQRFGSVDDFLAHLHRRVAERERGGS